MSARVHLSPDATVALVELEGTVRWRHLAAALLGLFGRDDSNPGLHVLWDARRVTRLDLPPQQVSALISLLDRVRGRYEGGRSAVLVRCDVDAAIARFLVWCGWGRGREYGVFDRLEEAVAFLGLPSARALPLRSERVLVVA